MADTCVAVTYRESFLLGAHLWEEASSSPPPRPPPSLVRMSLHTQLHTPRERQGSLVCSHIVRPNIANEQQWFKNLFEYLSHTDIMTIFLVSTSGLLALIIFQGKWSYRNLKSQSSWTQSVTVSPASLRMSLVSTCVMGMDVHKAACYRLQGQKLTLLHELLWALNQRVYNYYLKNNHEGTSLVVQWLRLCTSTAGSTGLIVGWGTKVPHAAHWQ